MRDAPKLLKSLKRIIVQRLLAGLSAGVAAAPPFRVTPGGNDRVVLVESAAKLFEAVRSSNS